MQNLTSLKGLLINKIYCCDLFTEENCDINDTFITLHAQKNIRDIWPCKLHPPNLMWYFLSTFTVRTNVCCVSRNGCLVGVVGIRR